MCNLFIRSFAEIFHAVYKENVSSFQCKINVDRSASMEEADGLSLILIDLHVTALTTRLHRGKTALQFSENIPLFEIYCVRACVYICIISREG